jgi:hypothetical protein
VVIIGTFMLSENLGGKILVLLFVTNSITPYFEYLICIH